jgi:hypothetical protein
VAPVIDDRMSEKRGIDSGSVVAREVGVRCEAEDCPFEMRVGVFEGTDALESLLRSLTGRETCPTCGASLAEWTPEFASVAPGRPAEW